ncbi:MAG: glycosyltransferase [Pyrinomonadaceae bacterium]
MTDSKRIVINTFGSFGDIHPYMAIAAELKTRGHQPVIATMEFYRGKIERAGLEFAPVRPNIPAPKEQDQKLIERIMEPKCGPRFLMEEIIFPAIRDAYDDLMSIAAGADLLITHPAAPAGPMVAHKTGLPWISTVLAPLSFFSAYDPPTPPFWPWLSKISVLGPRVMRLFLDTIKRGYKAEQVQKVRINLGIADYGNPMFEGQHSPFLVLAMFSPLFAAPQKDWPPQTEITGFAFYNGGDEGELPSELEEFLVRGEAPIVFTLGTSAVWVASDFFEQSVVAATKLGRRAVLLIGDERNQPLSLPETVIAIDYAPYHVLLPRACAVVHHGGVGTTAQSLRAGVPSLIVPFAFDQVDNAMHAVRLGTSRTVYRRNYKGELVTRELELVMKAQYIERARVVGLTLKEEHGASRAADLIEQFSITTANKEEEPVYASGH